MNNLVKQHKWWLYTWTSWDGQYWNQIDYILSSWRWRTSIQLAKTRPGVDCGSDHELLIATNEMKVTQSCPTLCNPMDYTVHGILQARILELVAFPISRGYSQPTDQTQVSCIAGRFFTNWGIREIATFRLKLKKVGKITRPFRYDLNQPLMIIQWRWWIDSRY